MMTDVISYMEHLAKRNAGQKGNTGLREQIRTGEDWILPEYSGLEDGEDKDGRNKD